MFTQRSKANLLGVHESLVLVMKAAHTDIQRAGYDIIITEGIRDAARQKELLEVGRSTTLNSRHLTGHAVDIAVVKDGTVTWEFDCYETCAKIIKETAATLGIEVEWGGDWSSFKDGTHFQLSWHAYPLQPHPKTAENSKTVAAAGVGFPIAAFIPEFLGYVQELIGAVDFFSDDTLKYIQFGAVLFIAGFVVWERVQKNRKEGV